MQRAIILFAVLLFIGVTLLAQFNVNNLIKDAQESYESLSDKTGNKQLSNDEIIRGLKEALSIGTENASGLASNRDGFLKNPKIKIPVPEEAEKMEKTLRDMGMGNMVDDFIESMNRAAEDASKEAAPIFVSAVKEMSVKDGMSILKGEDNAATMYLKDKTYIELTETFTPVVKKSIDKVKVTQYWEPMASAYNKLPMSKKVNPDLEAYITQKALDGLFLLLSEEEYKIRKDPIARVTDLLKKVFG